MGWLFKSKSDGGYVGKRRASGRSTAQTVKAAQAKRAKPIKAGKPNGERKSWWS